MTREELIERGRQVRTELGVETNGVADVIPGYNDFIDEVAFANVWDRPHLDRPERMICTLAALGLEPHLPQLPSMIGAALDLKLEPRSILEIFLQAGLYGGFVKAQASAAVAQTVFDERGVRVANEPQPSATNEQLDARGHELMGDLHGVRGTQGYAAADNPITSALYPAAIRYGYGALWYRPGLDRRQRMLVAIASFTALRLEGQLAKFSQSALNVGLTREQVIEAVVQTAPYSGFPPALNGLAILSKVLD